jgi:hypothetical protein
MTIIDFELLAAQYKKAAEALWDDAKGFRIADNNPKQIEMHQLIAKSETLEQFIDNIWRHDDADN